MNFRQLEKEVLAENHNNKTYDYVIKFIVDMDDHKGPVERQFTYHLKFDNMYQALDYITNTPHVLAPNQKILKLSIEQSSWGTHAQQSYE